MNLRTASIVLVAASLVAVPAAAVGAEGSSAYMHGAGINSCGSWTRGREVTEMGTRIPMNQEAVTQIERQSWVLGFLSAINGWYLPRDRGVSRHLSEGTDVNGLMAWIDNYCAANPQDNLAVATDALASEMADRWHTAHPPQ